MLFSGSIIQEFSGERWKNLIPLWRQLISFYANEAQRDLGAYTSIFSCLWTKKQGKAESPSLLAIDNQSVKVIQFTSIKTGIDGKKKINRRKRTIVVDSLVLPLSIKVSSANISDSEVGIDALQELKEVVPRMKKSRPIMDINLPLLNISKTILIGRSELHKNQNQQRGLFLKK